MGPARCLCGAELTPAVEPAPSPLVAVAKLLTELASCPAEPCRTSLPACSLDTASRLLWFFATDPSTAGSWRSRYMEKSDLRTTASMLIHAAPLLLDWPAALHRWLENACEITPARGGGGVRGAFGPALHRMLASLSGSGFGFLHSEVRRWLAEDWLGGKVKPWSPLFMATGNPGVVPIKQAATRLGVSRSRIVAMIAAGHLEGTRVRAGRRTLSLVRNSSLRTARLGGTRAAGELEPVEVAERLGVSLRQARRIRQSGLLGPVASIPCGDGAGFRADPMVLETRFAFHAVSAQASVQDLVSLADMPRSRRAALLPVLRAAAEGRIALYRTSAPAEAPLTAKYAVVLAHAIEVSRHARTSLSSEPCLSVRETAARLHLSVRMIPLLVDAGCLDGKATGVGHLGKRTLTLSSVDAFGTLFCTSRELADLLGTNTGRVLGRLAALGLRPLIPSNSAEGISAIWVRGHLTGLDIPGSLLTVADRR